MLAPNQGSNLQPLHGKVRSQPLDHQRSPKSVTFFKCVVKNPFKSDTGKPITCEHE